MLVLSCGGSCSSLTRIGLVTSVNTSKLSWHSLVNAFIWYAGETPTKCREEAIMYKFRDYQICQHLPSGYHSRSGQFLFSVILSCIRTSSSEFGTYRLCEQRRFRRACASAQSRQNLRCSLIQAVSQEEPSDRKPDPWSQ